MLRFLLIILVCCMEIHGSDLRTNDDSKHVKTSNLVKNSAFNPDIDDHNDLKFLNDIGVIPLDNEAGIAIRRFRKRSAEPTRIGAVHKGVNVHRGTPRRPGCGEGRILIQGECIEITQDAQSTQDENPSTENNTKSPCKEGEVFVNNKCYLELIG